MTQQPGQGWPQEDPYASGGQPPAYPQQQGYAQAQGYPQAPAYQQAPQYGAYGAGGYAPGYGMPQRQLAHWGQRVGAYLLDMAPTLLFIVPAAIVAAATAETIGYDSLGNEVTQPSGAGTVAMLLGYGGALAFQIWNRWVRQGRTGQSIGKKALGIRLVSEATMAPIGPGMAFVRDLCHIVDGFFYLGYLWPLWDAKRQTFADKILSTLVVVG